ncbi:hypothetical protein HNR46_000701 [Haloferula luteola]|uniref:Uncharacterized protein n=1 Tax=Haloferula luteola TaxID=595692 RepID=A0A840UWE2_9BACT|nr:hypothetical protein [Haloferula luteola]MBB5350477.1 hypothetical protein [Haloferula luteola]
MAKFARVMLGALLFQQVSAQDEPPKPEDGIRVRALAFVMGVKTPKELFAFSSDPGGPQGQKVEVRTYLNHQADMLPTTTKHLVLTSDPAPTSVQIPEKVIAKTTLPEGKKSVILLLVPFKGNEGDPPYRIFAVDDTRTAFPEGSLQVLNMSPTEVMFELDDEKFLFKSGTTRLIKEVPAGEDNLTDMRAFCRIGPGNSAADWKRIAATKWVPPGKKRVFQVLFVDPISQEIHLRGFTDIAKVVR